MNIIICGAGRVGFTIAKILSEQNHSITVIDQSSDDIQKINDSCVHDCFKWDGDESGAFVAPLASAFAIVNHEA